MVSVAIFDYGAGNIFSLKNSLEQAGASVDVITSFDKPNVYSGLLLPGVGNFDPAIKSINENSKTKFHEEGIEKGFNVIDGEIVVLPSAMKVPHMGWNNLEIKKPGIILEDVADDSWVYFVHSYRAKPTFDDVITAESDYGVKVPAVVEKNNFFGTQFHPEKSGDVGQIMIQNFLNVCKK